MNIGHGNHWECFGKPVKDVIGHFIPATTDKGKLEASVRRVGQWFGRKEPSEETVHSLVLGNKTFGSRVLLVTDSTKKQAVLYTAFPCALKGGKQRLVLKEIRDWGNEIEAVLVGENDDGAEIAFFDTRYFANWDIYRVEESYDFRISGLIYTAHCTNEKTITITDQDRIAAIKSGLPEEPERLPDGSLAPLVFHYAGCTGYAGTSEDYPEDAEFYCVIGKVDAFELEGIPFFKITPKSGDKAVPLPGVIFGAASVFKDGYVPKPGDSLGGGMWTMGFLDEAPRKVAVKGKRS